MQLSTHVSLADATASQTAARNGLKNQPPPELIPVLRATANGIYEPLWYATDGQIRISSFYRSEAVNAAVGGPGVGSASFMGHGCARNFNH